MDPHPLAWCLMDITGPLTRELFGHFAYFNQLQLFWLQPPQTLMSKTNLMLPLLDSSISNSIAGFHFKLQFRTKKQQEKSNQYQTNPTQVCTLSSPTLWRLSFLPQSHEKVKAPWPPHQIHVLAGWHRDLLLVMGRMDWEYRQWHKAMVVYTDLCKLSRDDNTHQGYQLPQGNDDLKSPSPKRFDPRFDAEGRGFYVLISSEWLWTSRIGER